MVDTRATQTRDANQAAPATPAPEPAPVRARRAAENLEQQLRLRRERETDRAAIARIDADLRALRTPSTRSDLGAVQAMAQRHDVPPEVLWISREREPVRPWSVSADGLDRNREVRGEGTRADGSQAVMSDATRTRFGAVGGGTGVEQRRTREAHEIAADGASRRLQNEQTDHVALTGDGLAGQRQNRETVTAIEANGARTEQRNTRTAGGSVNLDDQGRLQGSVNAGSNQRVETTHPNGTAERFTRGSNTSVGVVDGGNGLRLGNSGNVSRYDEAGGHGASHDSHVTLGNNGVSGGTTATGSIGAGPVRASAQLGASGQYTIDPRPIEGTQEYELVTTLRYDFTMGASLGTNSDRPGGSSDNAAAVGASYTVRRTQIFRIRMPAAEVHRYQGMARMAANGQPQVDGPPEMSLIARIQASARAGRMPSRGDVVVGRLRPGQTYEESDQTIGRVNASAQGSAGDVSAGARYARTSTTEVRRVYSDTTRNGVRYDVIRFEFNSSLETNMGANVAYHGVGGEGSRRTEQTRGNIVTVEMPRSEGGRSEAQQREIDAVQTPAQAQALMNRYGGSRGLRYGNTHEIGGGAGLQGEGGETSTGVRGVVRDSDSGDLTMETDEQGRHVITGTMSAHRNTQGGARVAGVELANTQTQTGGTVTMQADGAAVEARQTNTSSNPLFNRLWDTTVQEISGRNLTPADLRALVARAANEQSWNSSITGGQFGQHGDAWQALGALFRRERAPLDGDGRPRPELVQWNPTQAHELANGQAFVHFLRAVDPDGLRICRSAMRHFDPRQQIGTDFDWPAELVSQEPERRRLHAAAQSMRTRAQAFTGNVGPQITAEYYRLHTGLHALREQIHNCSTIDRDARVDMEQAIDRDMTEVARVFRELMPTPSQPGATPAAPATPASATPATPATPAAAAGARTAQPQGAQPAAPQARPLTADQERERHMDEIENARRLMQACRDLEQHHFVEAGRLFGHSRDGGSRTELLIQAEQELEAINEDWLGRWGTAWRTMREHRRAVGTEQQMPANLRPRIGWRIHMLEEIRGDGGGSNVATRWRREDESNP